MCFRVVCLSIPSVPTPCLKDPLMRKWLNPPGTFSDICVVRWSKLPGCRQLKDKKNFLLRINNYLLKRIGQTTIYSEIYSEKVSFYYPDTNVFVGQTVYSFVAVMEARYIYIYIYIYVERDRDRDRERSFGSIYEPQLGKLKQSPSDLIGWFVYWVLWHINLCRLFNAKSIFM